MVPYEVEMVPYEVETVPWKNVFARFSYLMTRKNRKTARNRPQLWREGRDLLEILRISGLAFLLFCIALVKPAANIPEKFQFTNKMEPFLCDLEKFFLRRPFLLESATCIADFLALYKIGIGGDFFSVADFTPQTERHTR
jgi:hypothetical protein